MSEFLVFTETLISLTDPAKNARSSKPVGIIDAGAMHGVSKALRERAHKEFNLKPNETPYFIEKPPKIHAASLDQPPATLCGRGDLWTVLDVSDFVDCKLCLHLKPDLRFWFVSIFLNIPVYLQGIGQTNLINFYAFDFSELAACESVKKFLLKKYEAAFEEKNIFPLRSSARIARKQQPEGYDTYIFKGSLKRREADRR